MNDVFDASNGFVVSKGDGRYLNIGHRTAWVDESIDIDIFGALGEYSEAARDEALGRWRDTVLTHLVVYPKEPEGAGRYVTVLNEATGVAYYRWENDGRINGTNDEHPEVTAAANRYFDAHPERMPWQDAKLGEVWLIDLKGDCEHCAVVVPYGPGVAFLWAKEHPASRVTIPLGSEALKSARRIWPEGDDDAEEQQRARALRAEGKLAQIRDLAGKTMPDGSPVGFVSAKRLLDIIDGGENA